MRTPLEVPFHDKEKAKSLGAKWDWENRRWYCPDGVDLMRFSRWLPSDLKRWKALPKARHRKARDHCGPVIVIGEHYSPMPCANTCTSLPWQDCDCEHQRQAIIDRDERVRIALGVVQAEI